MQDPRAHRAFGNVGNEGYLGARALLDFAKHEGPPLLDREGIERPHEGGRELRALGIAVRRWARNLWLAREASHRSAPSHGGSQVVPCVVDGDRDEKRAE